MSKPKTDPQSVINCGDANTAHLAYIAMFRYAFGRMTYMPGVAIEIIQRNAATIANETLAQLDRELTWEAERYKRVYKDKPRQSSNYGMECDRAAWLAFHEWVKTQIKKRGGIE